MIASAIVGGGLLLLTLAVLMTLLLAELRDSGEHIESQDRKVTALYEASQPVLEEAAPAAAEIQPVLAEAAPLIRRLRPFIREARPVVEALGPAAPAAATALRRLPGVTGAALRFAEAAIPLVEGFAATDLAGSVTVLRDLATSLSEEDRLVATIDATRELIAQIEERGLVDRAVSSSDRVEEILGVLRSSLAVQRRSLRVQRRSKAIQAQSLVHIESIDRKTGGALPAPSGGP